MSLTCDQFRQLLGDHLGDELEVEVRQSFEAHKAGCRDCVFYLESYTYTVRITRKLPKAGPLPAGLEAKLRAALSDHLPRGRE